MSGTLFLNTQLFNIELLNNEFWDTYVVLTMPGSREKSNRYAPPLQNLQLY